MRFKFSNLVVVDKEKGIVWARNANIHGRFIDIEEASPLLDNLNSEEYGGYGNWRLPTEEEFESLKIYAISCGTKDNFDEFYNHLGFYNVKQQGYCVSVQSRQFKTGHVFIDSYWDGFIDDHSITRVNFLWPVSDVN
jgi:hypothetical protein